MKLLGKRWRYLAGLLALSVATAGIALGLGVIGAGAQQVGAGATKQCQSPKFVGDQMVCEYGFRNLDSFGNPETFNSIVDVAFAASGTQNSGNIISSVGLIFSPVPFGPNAGAMPSCVGGAGAGTAGNPYVGATSCTVPGDPLLGLGAGITTTNFSWYTIQPQDFNLPCQTPPQAGCTPTHLLSDQVTFTWKCTTGGGSSCDPSLDNHAQANGSTLVQKRPSTTLTTIHNGAHQPVTTVAVGTTVHDFVHVNGAAGRPSPSGTVTIQWFSGTLGNECANLLSTSAPFTLDANGEVDAASFNFTPTTAGFRGFIAHYSGDGEYDPSDGVCEPLRVVDARITITPNGVNRVGASHTFTANVFVNDGTGETPAPDGTAVTFTIDSDTAASTPNPPAGCSTTGGSCTTTITSAVTGVTVVSAHTNVTVATVQLTRDTDGTHGSSGPATKRWVNAKIVIVPDATNEVGKPHTFVATLSKDVGDGNGFGAAAGEAMTITLTPSNGAVPVPAGPFNCTTSASGQCSVTFTSATPGKVAAHASSTLSVAGSAAFTVETDGNAPNSTNAIKTFVDANIQISPLTANNPVSTNHTLTGHVNINAGQGGGYVNAPAGTSIAFSITNSGGASAVFVGPSSCSTVGATGSCTVVISSSTTGTTTVKATTTVTVGGVPLTRATGDGKLGDSADAIKTWADDAVHTDVHNAAHTVITTAVAGTVVHDNVQVARAAGTTASVPNPTGTVVFHRFATINCSGTAVNQSVALTAGSPSTAESDSFATTADMSYQADYSGDANYPARSGACEPLTVTPVPQPAIAIVKNPKTQTVAINGTATFTITVTNTGNVPLTDVHVVDPLSPNCNRTKAQIPALALMAPGAAVTYTCTRPNMKCTGPGSPFKCAVFTNVATAIGTPPTGPDVTATDTAPVKTTPLVPKKRVKPKVVSHTKPKATG